ncbi:uncharacterized protein LOC111362099 isoform X2 [Spodoptera litura]|uniref:Uncharacterized protein LOC111362099 isoform X2 n=1 Tax=Spodoptera litura TaxID=69820 RepID=A0A9J7ETD2_SPOLT|nr:uncharacterized protein LOC111362099 isoform X2 [Spodoptera litura]
MSVKRERMPQRAESDSEVGRLVDCSQADDRRLIQLVRERRVLYARNNMPVASYYNQVKRLWLEVANKMGWSVTDVRRKWSHIRNSYSRHLRNEMHGVRTGRGRMVSKWYLADELDFLRQHMATDTRQSRHSYRTLYVPKPVASTHSDSSTDFMTTPWLALTSPSHASPLQLPVEPQPFREDSSSPHSSFEPDENSAYFHFFRGIHNDYQALSAKKQRLFRRECLAFLHRLLDEEDPRGQEDALDLSNSIETDDEKELKPFIISSVESIVGEHSDSTQGCAGETK